jgi:N-acetylmuramoyl-L-alanine amidase
MRYGLFTVGTSRLVLDVKGPVGMQHLELLPASATKPIRLVLDLVPTTDQTFRASLSVGGIASTATAAPALPLASPTLPPVKPEPAGKPVIAIDPGHGGVDPGAIGVSGTAEKTVTLAMARELKAQLEATGRYKVMLTRSSDIFVRLRDRIAIARAAGADLFLSLHADAHSTIGLRGASVYTLSEQASDSEAAALATQENKADLIAGVDLSNETEVVTNILIDLAQRETKNLSVRMAGMLVQELQRGTLLLHNSHRFAGFAVLKAPDVPSVLIELGYMSSPEDEALLRSTQHRAKLASAIVRAIQGYYTWQESLKNP